MTELKIREHLDQKANEFLALFEMPLREKIKKKMYFAGGCIYCLNNDKQPKDYDIFLADNSLIDELKRLELWSFTSEYALTYGKFQLVIKYYGNPHQCVGQFDFKHNMYYYIPFSEYVKSAIDEEIFDFFDDYQFVNTNELFFNEARARDIEGVYLRINKFVERGMKISKETKKKIKNRTTKKAVRKYKKSRSGGKNHY